jgi:hypothetical protein
MAKHTRRYTAREKWDDVWFNQLSDSTKLAFFYICDVCDDAGVWEPNTHLANQRIGWVGRDPKPDWRSILEELNRPAVSEFAKPSDKTPMPVVMLLADGKWWLTKFIRFQQGLDGGKKSPELNEQHWPHVPIFRSLRKHGLLETFQQLHPDVVITNEKRQKSIGEVVTERRNQPPVESAWSTKERIKEVEDRITELQHDTEFDDRTFKSLIKPESLAEIQRLKKIRDELRRKLREDGTNSNTSSQPN